MSSKPKMNGPVRGLLGRWMMRFEAAGQILSMAFQGTTAVSALSGVLAYTGREWVVPFVLVGGVVSVFAVAYCYVELGVYNRKNREKQDRGNNFAKPQNRIDDEMIGRIVGAAAKGRQLTEEERDAVRAEADASFVELRDGVEI